MQSCVFGYQFFCVRVIYDAGEDCFSNAVIITLHRTLKVLLMILFLSLSQVYEKRGFCGWRSNVATVGILPFLNYKLLLFPIVYGNLEIIFLKSLYIIAVVWNKTRRQKCQMFSSGGSRPINESQDCSDTAEEKQCKSTNIKNATSHI